jgi:hypothetical protein
LIGRLSSEVARKYLLTHKTAVPSNKSGLSGRLSG